MLQTNISFAKQSLPVIVQAESSECGIACLTMILSYYGHRTDLHIIRSDLGIGAHGATLKDLISFADKYELTARPIRIEPEHLIEVHTPCILHWEMDHFVVLERAGRNSITIHDPATGKRKLSYKEVSASFTGVCLELTPTKSFVKVNNKREFSFTSILERVQGLKRSFALIFLLSMLMQFVTLLLPLYTQIVIDKVIQNQDYELLLIVAIAFGGLYIFRAITKATRDIAVIHIGSLINYQLGTTIFRHLLRLPIDYFQRRNLGDIMSRFSSLESVKEMLSSGIVSGLVDGLISVFTLFLMFYYSPPSPILLLLVSYYFFFFGGYFFLTLNC